jgi:acetolactate synthase-1/2/3 large subunit
VFQADLPIQSRMVPLVQALSQWPSPSTARPWRDWRAQARADYQAHHTPAPRAPERVGVDMAHVVAHLAQTLPDDAVLTNGAGNYTVWLHRYYTYRQLGTELAPTNGAMGYGLPAAIAAKIAEPHRTVVCFAGDGCFMMYPQELATAVRYGAAVIVLVVNNGMLGTIRMHQEREYPGRLAATQLVNPDFVALAQALGAYAERVAHEADFPAAFARAQQSGRPALLELPTDPAQLTPTLRLTAPSAP